MNFMTQAARDTGPISPTPPMPAQQSARFAMQPNGHFTPSNGLHLPSNGLHSQSNGAHPSPNGVNARARRLRVVVTGGSAGIGRSIVETFAAAGHLVLFSYLRSVHASKALESAWKSSVTKTQLDQGDINSVSAFAKTVTQWCDGHGIDVLINNAALGSATVCGYVDSLPAAHGATAQPNGDGGPKSTAAILRRAEEDAALMRVNALGPMWVTEALEPLLRKAADRHGGRGRAVVIFIGSVGGGSAAVFPEYRPSDLMSKAAMTYLVKHLAAAYVRDNIDVLCVAPGATETDMFRQSTLSKVSNVHQFIDSMPKRELIQPCDIAATVVWLATENAARIFHGAVLDASLGLACRPGLQTESAQDR